MQGCFASLLRDRGALELLATDFRSSKDFPDEMCVFAKDMFCDLLIDVEEVVRSLANVSLKLQRGMNNTMANVVACYLDIFARSDLTVPVVQTVKWRNDDVNASSRLCSWYPFYVLITAEPPKP